MPPATTYLSRLESSNRNRDAAHARWSMLGNVRLIVAVCAIIAGWLAWNERSIAWVVMVGIATSAFVILAFVQHGIRKQRDAESSLGAVNQRALDRLHLNWDALPRPSDSGVDGTHPYANDLNIVGWGSVAQRIGSPATAPGWEALYNALLRDSDPGQIPERQVAIAELGRKLALRQDVERAALLDDGIPDAKLLLDWSKETATKVSRGPLQFIAVLGRALVLLAIVLTTLGVVPWIVILLPVALNSLVFFLTGGSAAGHVQKVVSAREAVASSHMVTSLIATDKPVSPLLRMIEKDLGGASSALASLSLSINLAVPAGSMLYFPLQMTTLWDLHVSRRLNTWRNQHGPMVAGWLQSMGEWEALSALSILAHDHPGWGFPSVDSAHEGLVAEQLAHPLLTTTIAVANDVSLSPQGTFLFVTGSNMSGKSTLLRAIGVNAVLAQAGAPVCATSMRQPPLQISTCMRVEDSLAHGVSFFMAELQRLKSVVDRVNGSGNRMALYLLDEILQGTNTAERQIASRRVLAQLVNQNAIGGVSSHDLELIEDTALEAHALPVHFAEQFQRIDGQPTMSFDYTLREGVATSSNAIRLMEILGFEMIQT